MAKRIAIPLLLFLWVFGTAAYFGQARLDWNANSRLSLTYAIVEQGTFAIDDYRQRPDFFSGGDCAEFEGHFYSDKIIGMSLLGVAPLFAAKTTARATGNYLPTNASRRLTTIFTTGLFAALTAVLLFQLLRRLDCPPFGAISLVAGYAFGTMAAGYATLFYSYVPAAFFALGSYYLIFRKKPASENEFSSELNNKLLLLAGLSLGLALLCEYTLTFIAIGLSILLLIQLRPRWRIFIYWAGAALPLTLFAAYTISCFGAITLPYAHLVEGEFVEGMSRGFMGVSKFELPVLWYVTLHPYRGLFFFSPFLLFSLWGLWLMRGNPAWRKSLWLIVFFLLAYLWLNASYNHQWWGGWTYAPRHLFPLLPFLLIPLVWVWRRGPAWRAGLLATIILAIALNMLATVMGPNYPQGYETAQLLNPSFADNFHSPLLNQGLKEFTQGKLQPNFGQALGFQGRWTLLPLVLFWIVMVSLLSIMIRREQEPPTANAD